MKKKVLIRVTREHAKRAQRFGSCSHCLLAQAIKDVFPPGSADAWPFAVYHDRVRLSNGQSPRLSKYADKRAGACYIGKPPIIGANGHLLVPDSRERVNLRKFKPFHFYLTLTLP